jgi:anti-sigma factor RsiW
MNIDDPVHADEALLQRYFDGALSDGEAEAFEDRLEREPDLAERTDRHAALFGALESRCLDVAETPDLAAMALASWQPRAAAQPASALPSTLSVFVLLDLILGGALAALFVIRGPVDVFKSWVLGLKDILVFAHRVAPSGEQAAVLIPVAFLVITLLLVSTGYGLRRVLIRTELRS